MRRAIVAIYLLGFVLTFGHETARMEREGVWNPAILCVYCGAFWPLYWPLRLSYLAFR